MGLPGAAAAAVIMATAQPASNAPAMGWRSWYAMPAMGLKNPTQEAVMASMDAMVQRRLTVDGKPTSLADLGFMRASVDGRYLACVPSAMTRCKFDCGGVNGSYHDDRGWPVVNKTSFPNVSAMVAHAHALGLTAGWYTNSFQAASCESGWSKTSALQALHMRGEAQFLAAMEFDEVKVDSGGAFNDMSWWQRALNATGRPIALENCHQGGIVPNATWCPFEMWRTSGDPRVVGWQREMLDTAQQLPLARRGCWAYPGYAIFGPHQTAPLNTTAGSAEFNDTRSSYGAHAVTSSPLILSFDVTPAGGQLDRYWPIVSNREVIAVNQRWAGSVGALVRKWNPAHDNASSPLFAWGLACGAAPAASAAWAVDPATRSVSVRVDAGAAQCLSAEGPVVGIRPCNATDPLQGFRLNASSGALYRTVPAHGKTPAQVACVSVWPTSTKGARPALGPFVTTETCDAGGSSESRSGRRWNLTADGRLGSAMGPCLVPQRGPPNMFGPMQLWSKPLPNGTAAVLVMSVSSSWGNDNTARSPASFNLSEIRGLTPGTARVRVRDLWRRADVGVAGPTVTTDAIDPGDSRFYLLTPVAQAL